MSKSKVLVVIGGQSTEHTVSRMSGTSVVRELNKDKYEIDVVGIDLNGQWYLLNSKNSRFHKGQLA